MMSLLLVYLYFYCEHTCLLCLGNENKSSFRFLLFCISLDFSLSFILHFTRLALSLHAEIVAHGRGHGRNHAGNTFMRHTHTYFYLQENYAKWTSTNPNL